MEIEFQSILLQCRQCCSSTVFVHCFLFFTCLVGTSLPCLTPGRNQPVFVSHFSLHFLWPGAFTKLSTTQEDLVYCKLKWSARVLVAGNTTCGSGEVEYCFKPIWSFLKRNIYIYKKICVSLKFVKNQKVLIYKFEKEKTKTVKFWKQGEHCIKSNFHPWNGNCKPS